MVASRFFKKADGGGAAQNIESTRWEIEKIGLHSQLLAAMFHATGATAGPSAPHEPGTMATAELVGPLPSPPACFRHLWIVPGRWNAHPARGHTRDSARAPGWQQHGLAAAHGWCTDRIGAAEQMSEDRSKAASGEQGRMWALQHGQGEESRQRLAPLGPL